MNPSNLERAAYLAAHRIMQADLTNPQFACPGTRRSKMVDAIAGIIKDVMEAEELPHKSTINHLWTKTPNWDCPHCKTHNLAIREKCRSCGYDSNAGEFPYYNPLPPYEGLELEPK